MFGFGKAGSAADELKAAAAPAFFEVLPPGVAARRSLALARCLTRSARFEELLAERRGLLAEHGVPVELGEGSAKVGGTTEPAGDAVLELYFHQLLAGRTTLLDLRRSRFGGDPERPHWSPASVWTEWDPDFLRSLVGMYRGFYEDDPQLFDASLHALGLSAGKEALMRHFGGDDQRAVRFEIAHFRATFQEVFMSCARAGASLHGDFVGLGVYLGTLYEHMSGIGGAWDVRAAWERAASR